jgi:S1-C subfamily serine protease
MGKEIEASKTRFEQKQIEKDISEFFEKIHKKANFLPSSFLENGVGRAQAVCRIVTDTSHGSGFLISSRNFIMTNNHVFPDTATPAASVAQFV